MYSSYSYILQNPVGITDSGIAQHTVEQLCSQLREIAAYHNRLYGIINALKKENAALKAKIEKPAPNYMDDLLGLGSQENPNSL